MSFLKAEAFFKEVIKHLQISEGLGPAEGGPIAVWMECDVQVLFSPEVVCNGHSNFLPQLLLQSCAHCEDGKVMITSWQSLICPTVGLDRPCADTDPRLQLNHHVVPRGSLQTQKCAIQQELKKGGVKSKVSWTVKGQNCCQRYSFSAVLGQFCDPFGNLSPASCCPQVFDTSLFPRWLLYWGITPHKMHCGSLLVQHGWWQLLSFHLLNQLGCSLLSLSWALFLPLSEMLTLKESRNTKR